ncbi:MAG: alcohol dehydrogenase catalytic domain-containing protein [Chloroflexota bacterium]|nr:alcohol dehydrogenase catalytic domain-containing protein [Chloroflexota bacterium]
MIPDTGKLVALVGEGSIEVRECPVPTVAEDAILLATGLTGICGTDVHMIYHRKLSPERTSRLPIVPGHEISGRIVRMGPRAQQSVISDQPLKEGDRVVGLPVVPCGKCWWCRNFGIVQGIYCEGVQPPGRASEPPYFMGGWGDYIYVGPGNYLWKVPDDMPYEVAVLTEPFSIAIRGAERALSLPAWKNEQTLPFGGTAVVLGAGAIGLLAAAAARIAGAGSIILVGAPQDALHIAQQAGVADHAIDVLETSPEERIARVRSLTAGGYGADVVFEAAGVGAAFVEGLEMVRRLGTFVELGNFIDTGETVPVNVPRLITSKDLTIYASYSQPPHYHGKAISVLARHWRQIPFQTFVTGKFRIDQAEEAMRVVRSPSEKGIKACFTGADYPTRG